MRNLDGTLYNWAEGETKKKFERMLSYINEFLEFGEFKLREWS